MTQQHLTAKEVIRLSQPAAWAPMAVLFSVGLWLTGISFNWQWVIGGLYFTFPFNFFAQGIIGKSRRYSSPLEFWTITLASNIPFWLCLWLLGNQVSALWICVVILVGALYSFLDRRFHGLPGLDVLVASFLITAPFTLGAYMSNGTIMGWLPAAAVLSMWAAAGFLLRDVVQQPTKSSSTVLGAEKTLMTVLALYAASAVAPLIFYGWYALPITALVTTDVLTCLRLLPVRTSPTSAPYGRVLQSMMRTHRLSALITLGYLAVLYALL
jgi:hypothetical protein